MEIRADDLSGGEVINLLKEHLTDMYATSPPESVHALDIEKLKSPGITFFSAWDNGELMGCVAIKELDQVSAELKSMRTSNAVRRLGVATQLLTFILKMAAKQGYTTINLETGAQPFFRPARCLYKKFGFSYCAPFANYKHDPNSRFMTYSFN